MARPESSIEVHPQRQRILDALATGQPYRDIEKWTNPTVTRGTLSRFSMRAKAKTRDAIDLAATICSAEGGKLTQAVTRAALQAAIDPFRARIAKHQATLDSEITSAAGDGRTVAALISTDLKGLELDARLTGRLDTAPVGNTTTFVLVPVAPEREPQVSSEPAIDVSWE